MVPAQYLVKCASLVCVVLQRWGCWVRCACVGTGVAGCAVRTCGWIPCCGTPGSAGSWSSWSPQCRPHPCLPSPPNWIEGWMPREGSGGRFPSILTSESGPLTACPPNTPSLLAKTCCVRTQSVMLERLECPSCSLMWVNTAAESSAGQERGDASPVQDCSSFQSQRSRQVSVSTHHSRGSRLSSELWSFLIPMYTRYTSCDTLDIPTMWGRKGERWLRVEKLPINRFLSHVSPAIITSST